MEKEKEPKDDGISDEEDIFGADFQLDEEEDNETKIPQKTSSEPDNTLMVDDSPKKIENKTVYEEMDEFDLSSDENDSRTKNSSPAKIEKVSVKKIKEDSDSEMDDIFGEMSDSSNLEEELEKFEKFFMPKDLLPPLNLQEHENLENPNKSIQLVKMKLPKNIHLKPKQFEYNEDEPIPDHDALREVRLKSNEDGISDEKKYSSSNFSLDPMICFRYVVDENDNYVEKGDGTFAMESNSKIVKYSDGSVQLVVGKNVFDMATQLKSGLGKLKRKKGGMRKKKNHIYNRSVDESFMVDFGTIDDSWEIRGSSGRGGFRKIGDGFKRRTKLTDKILNDDDLFNEKSSSSSFRGGIERELNLLKEKQRKKLRMAKEKNEDGGMGIKDIKKSFRKQRRNRKKGTGKRGRKPKRRKSKAERKRMKLLRDNEYEEDDFVVGSDEEDDDDLADDESDEIEEDEHYEDSDEDNDNKEDEEDVRRRKRSRKRVGRKRKRDDDSDEDEQNLKELMLYDDESGSDSDETYRPVKRRKRR